MSIQTRSLEYAHGDVHCRAYFACDDIVTGPRPGILIAHTWAGCDDFVQDKARQLAGLGYAALALDMYGDGKVGGGLEENAQLMGVLVGNRPLLRGRIQAALEALRRQPEVDTARIAAMGFCFGGLCVLDLARGGADLRGVVSVHGLFSPPEPHPGQAIKARVLVLHGHDDPMATPEQAVALGRELSLYGADWQIHQFGNTMHAFTNPKANDPGFGAVYSPLADQRSWRYLRDFLTEVLE